MGDAGRTAVRALTCAQTVMLALSLVACGQSPRLPPHSPPHPPSDAQTGVPPRAATPSTGQNTPTAQPPLASPQPAPAQSAISPERAQAVTVYALGLVGTPYRYGGNTPDTGFDCSGLIGHVYREQAGVHAPRTVASLKNWGQTVSATQLRSGDLVVFYQNSKATHAGIYVGEGRFVHAPSTGGRVRLDSVTSGYWARQGVSYQRP